MNRAVKREKYILPTIDDILPKLAHAKVFSLLDAASGFWQIPLDPESAKLTTFLPHLEGFSLIDFLSELPAHPRSISEKWLRF